MLNGLDLFSGIGGLTIALSPWVQPVAYCEIERYAAAVLLSRMSEGKLPIAPIWDDVTTLRGSDLPEIDIIYGGFPCQDISVAGRGVGLEGKRSGLFSEIMRLVDELQPKFIFLENVPAITTRGLSQVTAEVTKRRYDCRWTTLSAAEVGANHKRERWWLLAYSRRISQRADKDLQSKVQESVWENTTELRGAIPNSNGELFRQQSRGSSGQSGKGSLQLRDYGEEEPVAYTMREGLERQREKPRRTSQEQPDFINSSWWSTEPSVGRVVNGLPFRVDRIKGLGNAVVPACAREAFKRLAGLN